LEHLKIKNIVVERQTELISFTEANDSVTATIKNNVTGNNEKIYCKYIIGCDGAHSTVREALGIPFVGASYQQEFLLADVSIDWPFAKDKFTGCMSKEGIFLIFPLRKDSNLYRLMLVDMNHTLLQSEHKIPTLQEIENFCKRIIRKDIALTNPVWLSRFYLHHRAVAQYLKGRAFLAGDAAHIHSPVGGQGMNTGLQDVTNLAWKIALVLKYHAPNTLLQTYQTERQRIGEVLLNSTDKIFGMITNKKYIASLLRLYVMPLIMNLLTRSVKFKNYLFHFISELGIHYHENLFVMEKNQGADAKFLAGPQAGCRAPDAPIVHSTLFELFKQKPCNVLLFQTPEHTAPDNKIAALEQINAEVLGIHQFIKSPDLNTLFERYGITSSGVYFIRPDGYIGFRAFGNELESLAEYLAKLFGHSLTH